MLVTLLWRVSCIDLPETCKHCDSVVFEHPDRLNRRKNQAVYGIISFGASWVVEKKHFRKEDLSIGISSESLCCTSEECYIRCCDAILCSSLLLLHVVVNSVLLKCRKLRREDQETSDSIVGFFIKSPKLMVAAVIEISLKSFLQGIFIGRIGGGTFWRLRQNIK